MNNLSKIEKEIINFIVDSDIINDQEENSNSSYGIGQKNGSTIETLILSLFLQDDFLIDVGLIIDFDADKNNYTIHIEEIEDTDSPIFGNWNVFQKVNYLLVKIANFLDQLERDGYLDKVTLRNTFENRRQVLPYYINHKDNLSKSIEIKSQEIVNQILACFAFVYVPNFKLREFRKNNYKTPQSIQAEKDFDLAKSNIKIARIGLYTAVISAIASLVAIILTLYSLGIPATVKINDNQVNEIKQSILSTKPKPSIQEDSLKNNKK